MRSANINYVSNYFEYPTLTKSHCKPTYKTLRELKIQLKVNASAVTSVLGEGSMVTYALFVREWNTKM